MISITEFYNKVLPSKGVYCIITIEPKEGTTKHYYVETIAELEHTEKPTILVFNKIDAYVHIPKEEDDPSPILRENISLEELKKTWMSKMNNKNCVFISAENKDNIEELKSTIYEAVKEIFKIRYPYHHFLY